jgi:Tol biopolymer transport system component
MIRVLDVAADTSSTWGMPGRHPQWSPTGDVIALVSPHGGSISIVNADGTAARILSEPDKIYIEGPFSWSPDGQWLLVKNSAGPLDLIHVASGLTLPLPFTGMLYNPAWQPES